MRLPGREETSQRHKGCPWRRLHVVCGLLPVRDGRAGAAGAGGDGVVRLRISRRRARRRAGRGVSRNHPRGRFADFSARHVDKRRAGAVYVLRHHQAAEAADAAGCWQRGRVGLQTGGPSSRRFASPLLKPLPLVATPAAISIRLARSLSRSRGISMRVQQPVRDRNMSLWQSAVRETLVNRGDLSDGDKKQAEYGVSLHALSVQTNEPLALPTPQPQAEGQSPVGSPSNIAQGSKAAFEAIQAHQNNDSSGHFWLFSMLRDFVMKYSSWDVEGWVQCGWYYTKYYVLAHLPPSYNDWQAHAPADINFGVIDYLLPALGSVASPIVFSASSNSSSFHCSKLKPFGGKLADEK